MTGLRVAILRADDHHHLYLEWLLRTRFNVVLTAVEPGAAKIRRLRQAGRYRDYAYCRYHGIRRWITGKDAYRKAYFQHSPELPDTAGTIIAQSINAESVVNGLRQAAPDVTVVIGCSILRRAALTAAGPRVVNVHGGMLPDYKGNHCVFFAVYDGRPDLAGVTLHHVIPDVDAGPIIEVIRPGLHPRDTPEQLYCRAEKVAINRLVVLLERLAAGIELPAFPQEACGHTYRTRDRGPVHDLRLWARRMRMRAAA
jgi:methionyl-tRNA formyltransferase